MAYLTTRDVAQLLLLDGLVTSPPSWAASRLGLK